MSTIQAINKVVSPDFASIGVITTSLSIIATTATIKSKGRPILFGVQRSSTGVVDEFGLFKATGTSVGMTIKLLRTEVGGSTITLSQSIITATDGASNGAGTFVPNSIMHLDLTAVKGKSYYYYLEAKLNTASATASLMGSLFALEI